MPRKLKLEGLNARILEAIGQGLAHTKDLESRLDVGQALISQHIKRLEVAGYLTRKVNGILTEIALTPLGERAVAIQHNAILPTYRIHDFWLTFQLKEKVGNDTTKLLLSKRIGFRPLYMKNHTDSYFTEQGYEARLNPSSIEIHLKDLDNLPLEADLTQASFKLLAEADYIFNLIEDRLGIKVIRLDKDTIVAKISQLHIALKNHQFAETINENGEKLYVYVDSELRVIVDKSHGLDEYEAVNPKHAIKDAQKLGAFSNAVITGQFDYEKNNQILEKLVLSQEAYGKNLEAHAIAIGKMNVLLDQINQKRSEGALPRFKAWLFGGK